MAASFKAYTSFSGRLDAQKIAQRTQETSFRLLKPFAVSLLRRPGFVQSIAAGNTDQVSHPKQHQEATEMFMNDQE
jgi:hypothetical protein